MDNGEHGADKREQGADGRKQGAEDGEQGADGGGWEADGRTSERGWTGRREADGRRMGGRADWLMSGRERMVLDGLPKG